MEEKIDTLGLLEKAIEATPTTNEYIVDLERQLAEALSEVERQKSEKNMLRVQITGLEDQLSIWQTELEAMRPMVEACKERYERHNQEERVILVQCPCLTCQWYRDYLERKQP